MGYKHLVAIVDDNEALSRSISRYLQSRHIGTRVFNRGESFLQDGGIADLHCVILDLRMPGLDGLEILRRLQGRSLRPAVLVLTGHGDVAQAVEAMKLGALDFIEKPFSNDMLLEAVNKAIAETERGRAEAAAAEETADRLRSLSRRQMQVLVGLAQGKLNKIIAYELDLSIRTVEAYRAQVLEKLGVRGTAEAVRIAVAGGLVDAAPAGSTPAPREVPEE